MPWGLKFGVKLQNHYDDNKAQHVKNVTSITSVVERAALMLVFSCKFIIQKTLNRMWEWSSNFRNASILMLERVKLGLKHLFIKESVRALQQVCSRI